MPGFNGTGPLEMGPLTGRGFGPCGLGRYFNWIWPQSPKDQKQALADYKKALEEELENVGKEIRELK